MPVAGAGSRFRSANGAIPKPLIEIQGRPMAAWAFASLAAMVPGCVPVLVVLRDHVDRFAIDHRLRAHLPGALVAIVERPTGGSLETCVLARDSVAAAGLLDEPVVVLDCDLAFRASAFAASVLRMSDSAGGPDGVLLSFRSDDPRYSYAEITDGRAIRTAEKTVISNHALAGAYGFASMSRFFALAHAIIAGNLRVANGEFYTSSVYNRLIADGGSVVLSDAEQYWSMGTPDELAASLSDPEFLPFLQRLPTTSPHEAAVKTHD